jgi:hypothetical protein
VTGVHTPFWGTLRVPERTGQVLLLVADKRITDGSTGVLER